MESRDQKKLVYRSSLSSLQNYLKNSLRGFVKFSLIFTSLSFLSRRTVLVSLFGFSHCGSFFFFFFKVE